MFKPRDKIKTTNFVEFSPPKIEKPQSKSEEKIEKNLEAKLSENFSDLLKCNFAIKTADEKEISSANKSDLLKDGIYLTIRFTLKPFSDTLVITVNKSMILKFISISCGQKFSSEALEQSDLSGTNIEIRLLKKFAKNILASIEEVWSEYYPVSLSTSAVRIGNVRHQLDLGNNPVRHVRYALETDSNCQLNIMTPINFSQKIANRFSYERENSTKGTENLTRPDQADRSIGVETLKSMEVEVKVELGSASIKVRDLLKLGPGDILQLENSASEPIKIMLNGQEKFKCVVGAKNGMRAVKIVS